MSSFSVSQTDKMYLVTIYLNSSSETNLEQNELSDHKNSLRASLFFFLVSKKGKKFSSLTDAFMDRMEEQVSETQFTRA